MKVKKKKLTNKLLLLFVFILCMIGSGLLLKALLVRQKWFRIAYDTRFSVSQSVEHNGITGNNRNKIFFYNDSLFKGQYDEQNPAFCLDTNLIITRFSYDWQVSNPDQIEKISVGVNYPVGFILRVNDSISVTSPNVIFNNHDSTVLLLMSHTPVSSEVNEFFYFNPRKIVSGSNKIDIDIISTSSISAAFHPGLIVNVLKDGIFLFTRKAIVLNKSNSIKNSQLPVLSINTLEGKIQDEPKVKAELLFPAENGNNKINIRIEKRGKTSQLLGELRNNYSLETYSPKWKKSSVSLLGLPEDIDWVLYVPYLDRSLIRNALSYYLSGRTGQYAPRYKFCELLIDNEYMGLYLLVEKPKLSDNRVNAKTLEGEESAFFCQIDREDSNKFGWKINTSPTRSGSTYVNVVSPKLSKITTEEQDFIRSYVENLNNQFQAQTLNHSVIDSLIDIDSFIDYILINELSKNLDAYRLSCYFSKPYDEPLKMGPVWDFDLAYGNTDVSNYSDYAGWCYQGTTDIDECIMLNWADRLLKDPIYKEEIAEKWKHYRQTFMSNDSLMYETDKLIQEISIAGENYFNKVPVLDDYLWSNVYVGGDYKNEIFYLKCWLLKRLFWMDSHLKK
jgi:hypothetical protein